MSEPTVIIISSAYFVFLATYFLPPTFTQTVPGNTSHHLMAVGRLMHLKRIYLSRPDSYEY
jgi:hypothetical protein